MTGLHPTSAVEAMIVRASAKMAGAARVARDLGSDPVAVAYENCISFLREEGAVVLDGAARRGAPAELPLLEPPAAPVLTELAGPQRAGGQRAPYRRIETANAGCHWQQAELAALREGWLAGTGIIALGDELKRSPRAILHAALRMLDLQRRPGDAEEMRAFRRSLAAPTTEIVDAR